MPEISVIVPVYKVEPYLRRCVDSILGQTFTDFEVILVDDGSPDACPAICDEYAGKDERVRVIHQENGGLSAARNAGLDWVFSNSDSRWISFVDSDDWVHPRFLEYLHRAVIENNTPISVCNFQKTKQYFNRLENISYSSTVHYGLNFFVENGIIGTVAWNKLYRKELFFSRRYPIGKLHEDEFLTYLLLYDANNIAYISLKLYYYYSNPTGIMNSAYTISRLDAVEAIELQYKFISELGQDNSKNIMLKRLVDAYTNHIHKLDECKDKNAQEMQSKLRIKLRKVFPLYRKIYTVSVQKNAWYYEAAYPNFMSFYWKWQAFKTIINRDGTMGILKRIWRKLCKQKK